MNDIQRTYAILLLVATLYVAVLVSALMHVR